jgi:hypothetical protein
MSIFNFIRSFVLNLYKPRSNNAHEVSLLKSEELYEGLAQSIIVCAMKYREKLEEPNNQYSADAGAEIMYFLLNVFDRYLFKKFSPQGRDEIFDNVSMRAIAHYGKAVLKSDSLPNIIESVCVSMMNALSERQESYSKCATYFSDGICLSGQGSMLFALKFYIHRALRKTERKDLDEDLLCGKRAYDISDNRDFPKPQDAGKLEIFAMCTMTNITECWNSLLKYWK